MSNRKIIIACDTLFSGLGGMEKLAIELGDYLSKGDFVQFLFTHNMGKNFYSPSNNIESIFCKIDHMPEVELDKDYDIYIYFCVNHNLIDHFRLAKKISKHIVVTESATPDRIVFNNWKRGSKIDATIDRYSILSKVDAIRVEIPESKSRFPSAMTKKVRVFPNSTKYIEDADRNYAIDNYNKQRIGIVLVGGRKPHKRLDILVDAICEMDEKLVEKMDIFLPGTGNEGSDWVRRIKGKVEKCNMMEKFHFMGNVSDMTSVYKECAIHVICSADESFGLSTIESLAFGIPSIGCADAAGTRNIIKNNVNGLLYHGVENNKELSELLEKLMCNYRLYNKLSKGAYRSRNKYSEELYYKNWDKLLDDVVNGKYKLNINKLNSIDSALIRSLQFHCDKII